MNKMTNTMELKPNYQNIGNAGEYFMASILSAHGFTTTITLGRAEAYDIIAISPKGKTVKIQVKTAWAKTNSWRLDIKNENVFHDDFFYAFVRLNEMKSSPDYWIIPSKIVAPFIKERHSLWLKTLGKKGQQHNDNNGRTFTIVPDKFIPQGFEFSQINQSQNNLQPILNLDDEK